MVEKRVYARDSLGWYCISLDVDHWQADIQRYNRSDIKIVEVSDIFPHRVYFPGYEGTKGQVHWELTPTGGIKPVII